MSRFSCTCPLAFIMACERGGTDSTNLLCCSTSKIVALSETSIKNGFDLSLLLDRFHHSAIVDEKRVPKLKDVCSQSSGNYPRIDRVDQVASCSFGTKNPADIISRGLYVGKFNEVFCGGLGQLFSRGVFSELSWIRR
ncbi:hypothetical protein TNCV_2004951 [Trichonephila clavipes]|nr:hypothetical protein TNCV_2004951 [Trichonephila clavipes]